MRVAALLSGGVDSSVALLQLVERGFEVEAFYLKIWLEDELQYLNACPWEEDIRIARSVCDRAGVPLHVISMQQEYYNRVVVKLLQDVQRGETPNPDIWCNQRIKFGAFLDKIQGFDVVASGHYARLTPEGELSLAADPLKDQTYFLSQVDGSLLKNLIFPLGEFTKSEVREQAEKYDLINAGRKDSQGICFLGKFKYRDFLQANIGDAPGKFVEWETGETLGEHQGCHYYTDGQRRGIGLHGGPWFVHSKNHKTRTVYISKQLPHYESVIFSSDKNLQGSFRAKIRHSPEFLSVEIRPHGKDYQAVFEKPEPRIAQGQYIALYSSQGVCCASAKMQHLDRR